MDVLGKPVSSEIESLYKEIEALRPGARLEFRSAGGEEVDEDAGHGGYRSPTGDGAGEIFLRDDFDQATLAHELLHAYMDRNGFPHVRVVTGLGSSYFSAGSLIQNCANHAVLYAEAKKRNLPLERWPRQIHKMNGWESDEPPTTSDAGMANVRTVAEVIAFCPIDASDALAQVNSLFPATFAMGEAIATIISGFDTGSPIACRQAMVAILELLDRAILADFPDTTPLKQVMVLDLILSTKQLQRPGTRNLEVKAEPDDSGMSLLLKRDQTLIAAPFKGRESVAAEVKQLRQDLRLTTAAFISKHRVECRVEP